MKNLLLFFSLLVSASSYSQLNRWQQKINYVMNIDVDVNTNKFIGKQVINYSNNSPDNLNKVYFNLYLNAFKPNSSMDIRSRELGNKDWDQRIKDTILGLKENEQGYQKITSLKLNGVPQKFFYHETILEVQLNKPILPGTTVKFEVDFEAQIPIQIRRTGRDNAKTGVRYSMSQWYPKLCEYDNEGWQLSPYIAREFYGVWGDFDVTINIDKDYKLAGTGVLANAAEIGWGYDNPGTSLKLTTTNKRKWRFVAKNVHDFVWAADPDYKHIVKQINNGPVIHVVYKNKPDDLKNDSAWLKVADAAVKVFPFIESNFGKYPYPQYSFIQGGDGGMEYAMATLVFSPSLGTAFHELMHSWYQMVLGFNELKYPWMDEGFANYTEDLVSKFYNKRPTIQYYLDLVKQRPDDKRLQNIVPMLPEDHSGSYLSYYNLVQSGLEEPLTTPADHYNTNYAYGSGVYSKGEVFLEQLGYIVGADVRDKILLEFYNKWKFQHPDARDFMSVAQKTSGLQLNWYYDYWISSTKTIDYGIDSLWEENGVSKIRLSRIGKMPMPIDFQITYSDGSIETYNIPLDIMYGSKNAENKTKFIVNEPWKWVSPKYTFEIKKRLTDIKVLEIDPTKRMADIQRRNNKIELDW